VVHIAHFHEFLEIVADIAALVITAGFQLARGHFVLADVEHQQRLDRVHLEHAEAFEFILDDIKKQPVQPLHQ